MQLIVEERPSDSPYIERVWQSRSEDASHFTSIANNHWELVFWWHHGNVHVNLRGPETRATSAPVPGESEWVGILFKLGTSMPLFPANTLVDDMILLPEANSGTFWLNGSVWQYPSFENAETFVDWLERDGLLISEPVVQEALRGYVPDVSVRTVQRRFVQTTGLTQGAIFQIERARYATTLLQSGVSILDTVEMADYFDQPHLTRALKRYIGKTPAQLSNQTAGLLSFLYKKPPVW